MTRYKRSIWELIKGIVSAPCGGFLVYLVLSFFVEDQRILVAAGVVVCLLILYMSVISENIYFELYNTGELRYYKQGKLKNQFQLQDCRAGYRRRGRGGPLSTHDVNLQIINDEATSQREAETWIDCSPLGARRFEKMFEQIRTFTREDPNDILQAGPAGE